MKIWYIIRRPIGIIVFTYVIFVALAAIHAIPEVLFRLITGQF